MITIIGEEGIPVQVDGEAWIQKPGLIKIKYKNAAQMLMRDRVSEKFYLSAYVASFTATTFLVKKNSPKGALCAFLIRHLEWRLEVHTSRSHTKLSELNEKRWLLRASIYK